MSSVIKTMTGYIPTSQISSNTTIHYIDCSGNQSLYFTDVQTGTGVQSFNVFGINNFNYYDSSNGLSTLNISVNVCAGLVVSQQQFIYTASSAFGTGCYISCGNLGSTTTTSCSTNLNTGNPGTGNSKVPITSTANFPYPSLTVAMVGTQIAVNSSKLYLIGLYASNGTTPLNSVAILSVTLPITTSFLFLLSTYFLIILFSNSI